jgi:hypothetical protein
LILSLVLDVDIAYHVVSNVISDHYFIDLSVLGQLCEYLLIEILEVVNSFDQGLLRNIQSVSKCDCSRWVVIQMLECNSLGERRLVMNSGASVSMSACSYLEVESTINSKMGLRLE